MQYRSIVIEYFEEITSAVIALIPDPIEALRLE